MKIINDKGQAVILLLLVMVIGLTIGLSIVSKSILDIKQSGQSEESSRAFTAAEAGVEVALEGLEVGRELSGSLDVEQNSRYTCTKDFQGAANEYVFPYRVEKDRSAQFYFAEYDQLSAQAFNGDKIRVVWGNEGVSDPVPAMEASLIYYNTGEETYKVAKFALDPNSSRAAGNGFCPPAGCSGVSNFKTNGSDEIITADTTVKFQFGADINVASFNSGNNFLVIGRFRLLYNPTAQVVGVTAENVFPSQGMVIDCLGQRTSGVSRRVKVFENHPQLPDVFDYVLYNGNPSSVLGH